MQASGNGHKDIAVALVEKGADLTITNQVSDCQLCIDDDVDDNNVDDDDYDDYADVSVTLVAFIYMHMYLCTNVYLSSCACVYTWVYTDVYMCSYSYV